jgi:hypothetical protein
MGEFLSGLEGGCKASARQVDQSTNAPAGEAGAGHPTGAGAFSPSHFLSALNVTSP